MCKYWKHIRIANIFLRVFCIWIIKVVTLSFHCSWSFVFYHFKLKVHCNISLYVIFSYFLISFLTVCSYDVTYAFQNECTFYSYLNVKELLAGNRRGIWSLNDCNWTRTHNHIVGKRTLNHLTKLAKWLSCVSTYL